MKFILKYILLLPILFQQFDIYLYFKRISPIPSFSIFLVNILLIPYFLLTKKKFPLNKILLILHLFFTVLIISIFNSLFFSHSDLILSSNLHLFLYVLYAILIILYASDGNRQLDLIDGYIDLSWGVIFFGFFQFLVYNILNLDFILLTKSTSYTSDFVRVSSIFNEPSWFGLYININLIFLLFIRKKSNFFLICNLLSLFLTLSLSSYVIFILIYLIYLIKKYPLKRAIFFILFFALLFISYIFLNNTLNERISLIFREGSDVGGGFVRFQSSFGQFQLWLNSNVFTGVGFGNSANLIDSYYEDIFKQNAAELSKRSGDSMFMLLLSEIGLIGFIIVMFIFNYQLNKRIIFLPSYKIRTAMFIGIIIIFFTQGFLMEPKLWLLLALFFSI
jgi:hypothetical protein